MKKFMENTSKIHEKNIIYFKPLCRFWPNAILNYLGRSYTLLMILVRQLEIYISPNI